jgi:ABC-type lipoprotein export system ATPase subunit
MNDPRGSLWRKWDFHVHTPASFHWSDGKHLDSMTPKERDQFFHTLAQAIQNSEIAAFVIMDYWCFDGYLRFRQYLSETKTELDTAVFPGIELRCEIPSTERLNIHALLSNELTDQQLQDFLHELEVLTQNKKRKLSKEALIESARCLTTDQLRPFGVAKKDLESDEECLRIGCQTAIVTRESLANAIESMHSDGALLYVPFDTYGGLREVDHQKNPLLTTWYMSKGHFFEVHDTRLVDCFHIRKTDYNQGFISSFSEAIGGKPKPTVCGSDAHRLADYGCYPLDKEKKSKTCWVKADTTFLGIRQIMAEPALRTFIGEEPPQLASLRKHPTKYIKSVTIRKKADSDHPEDWFDADIPLNPGLVAVIGNRGTGKSALTDVIGLLGNSRNEGRFTFLHGDRFRNPKSGKAQHYEGVLTWESGPTNPRSLNERTNPQEPELIRYLPQSFIELVCNEISSGSRSAFDQELKAVIYSHVPGADRLGKTTLDALIDYKTSESQQARGIHKFALSEVNAHIARLERQLTLEFRQGLQNNLKQKELELDAHNAKKPVKPELPDSDEQQKTIETEIEGLKRDIIQLDSDIETSSAQIAKHTQLLAQADGARNKLSNLKLALDGHKVLLSPDLDALGIPFESVVTFGVDYTPLDSKKAELQKTIDDNKSLLDPNNQDSYPAKKLALNTRITKLREQLEGPAKANQDYQKALEEWTQQLNEIVGSAEVPNTLESLRYALTELDKLPEELEKAEQKRLTHVKELYGVITRLVGTYKELYKPVQDFVREHSIAANSFGLEFEVNLSAESFRDQFWAFISQGRTGSFYGAEDGDTTLKTILSKHDFSTENDTLEFLQEILDHLCYNHKNNRAQNSIEKQMKNGKTIETFYDLLFSLDYLKPQYTLKFSGKDLTQLSPGERGILLLVFYLLVDKDDIPLVIDQPEENLDNETVYRLLGKCIRVATLRRQVIIVTHNPNLAVACDADQVICATHDSSRSPIISYESGAIENPIINQRILDILEGTRPAFDNRGSKYYSVG